MADGVTTLWALCYSGYGPSLFQVTWTNSLRFALETTLLDIIRDFVRTVTWTEAITYRSTWPHEYTLLKNCHDKEAFLEFASSIFADGKLQSFYSTTNRYLELDGKLYWSMDSSPAATDLINRCNVEDSYENRLRENRLP